MVTFLVRQRPAAVTFQMTQCDDRAPWGCAECAWNTPPAQNP
jgi:hypothetical protein